MKKLFAALMLSIVSISAVAHYPNPKGDYFIFRMDEEVNIGAFDINKVVNEYIINNRLEHKGQPIYVTGEQLLKHKH